MFTIVQLGSIYSKNSKYEFKNVTDFSKWYYRLLKSNSYKTANIKLFRPKKVAILYPVSIQGTYKKPT